MNSQIRKVQEGDKEAILKILSDGIGQQYFEEIDWEIDDSIYKRRNADGIVIFDSVEEVIGYLGWRKRIETAYIENLGIKGGLRGHGFGSILIKEGIEKIKNEDPYIKRINVVTDADALKNISFYAKNGFEASGIVNDEFIIGTSQIHMSLRVNKK